ncbi:MAG: tetratricopeptide repeat protein [Oculatellaceae cyanobacterium Prado106]|nr:tetratricopeptide repeat protein [Oculatellaceae cyanobacterium Prado106]
MSPILALSFHPLPVQAQTLQEGYALLEKGWVGDAISVFEAVVRQNPRSVEAQLGLATAYFRAGSVRQSTLAFETYRKVRELDPDNRQVLTMLGTLGGYKFEWRRDGISALSRLIELEPNNMEARAQRALLNGYQGNLSDAILDYDIVLPTNPPPEVILAAAQTYTYAGDYPKGLELFNRYRPTGKPIEGYAAIAYGIVLRETGDPAQSVQVLEQELNRNSGLNGISIRTRAALGVSYAQVDQIEKAMQVLKPLGGRFDSRMILARTFHQINRKENSADLQNDVITLYYEILAKPEEQSSKINYLTTSIAREMADVLSGIPAERRIARELYVQLVKQLPSDRILPVNLAIVERQLGLISRAALQQRLQPVFQPLVGDDYQKRLLAQALVRLDSPDPPLLPFYQALLDASVYEPLLYFRVAQIQLQQNDLAGTRASLQAYSQTPEGQADQYGPLLLLAEIDRREGNLEASVQKYEQIIVGDRVDRGLLSGSLQALAGIRRIQGRLPEAIALYDQIIERDPSDLSKRLGRASLAYQADQISLTEAEGILQEWLATRPATDTPLELYSLVAALPADPQREPLYTRLLETMPESVPVRLRALQVVAMRDPDAARAQLAQLIANDPENLGAYFVQGELAQDLGDLDLASNAYETILERSAQNTDALAALGGIRFQQRQYDEATDLYTEVLKMEPSNQVAQTALAELTVVEGNRIEALRRLEELQQQRTPEGEATPADPSMDRRIRRIQEGFLQQRGFQPPWERY